MVLTLDNILINVKLFC